MDETNELNPILKELLDFVNGWKSQKGISPTAVLSGDTLIEFVKNLQDKIVEVAPLSGKPGQKLILYSGKSPSTGEEIYKGLKGFCNSNHDFYYINSTEGGAVLWDSAFQGAIRNTVGDESVATRILSGKELDISTGKPGARINQYAIEGTDILALDDFISKTLTRNAIKNGNSIVYVAGTGADPNCVGALTELPEAMNEFWIGKTLDEALANKITVVGDLDQIVKPGSNLISDFSLSQTRFYTDSSGKIVGIELKSEYFSKDFSPNVGQISPEFNNSTYGSQPAITDLATKNIVEAEAKNKNVFKSAIKAISKHPDATARILSYGAVGVSAVGMIKEAAAEFEADNDIEGYRKIARWTVTTEASTAAAWGVAAVGAALGGPVGLFFGLVGGAVAGWAADIYSGIYFDGFWFLFNGASNAQPPRDPLAIDLGALGIDLTTLENGVNFDLDKNGFAEKTAWLGIEDGFLVLDRNNDGIINDGGESFLATRLNCQMVLSPFRVLRHWLILIQTPMV